MTWKDVGKVVGKVAPVLGTVIGGPAGGAIGGVIASLLGTENDPDKVVEVLKTNPDALVKLKEYEMQHKEKLQELQLENLKVYMQDIQNARQRQVEHEKATGKSDINLYVLAWVVVLGFYVLLGTLLFVTLPKNSNNIIYLLFGTLSTGFGMVLQYFFGSSKGSSDKTKLLASVGMIQSPILPIKETTIKEINGR